MTKLSFRFTDEQIDEFNRDGVLIVRGLLDDYWLEKMAGRAKKLYRDGEQSLHVNMFVEAFPEFRDFIYESGVAELMGQVSRSRAIRLLASELFCKPPVPKETDNTLDWHSDLSYTPIRGTNDRGGLFSSWIALGRVTREMGAVRFMRGSHKWPHLLRQATGQPQPEGIDTPDFSAIDDNCPGALQGYVVAEMEPGDCALFTGRTAHSSSPNHSKDWRVGYSIRWLDEAAVYAPGPGTMQPPEEWEAQRAVGLVPGNKVDRFFPLVWSDDPAVLAHDRTVADKIRKPEFVFHGAGRNSDVLARREEFAG